MSQCYNVDCSVRSYLISILMSLAAFEVSTRKNGVQIMRLFFYIFYLILFSGQLEALLDSSTLVTVNLFTRHEARSPLIAAPSPFLFKPVNWGVNVEGQLTNVGKQRMFEFGKKLREKYKGFLNDHYVEVQVMSTPTDRTKFSALALMAGLYNKEFIPEFPQSIYETLDLVVENDEEVDKSNIINDDSCPEFRKAQNLAITTAIQNDKGFEDVYQFLTELSGIQVTNMFDIFSFWDNLECLAHNGLELPTWSKRVYPERMSKIQAKVLQALIASSDKMVRLTSGSYLQELHKQFTEASLGDSKKPKLRYHSGHDFSMTANLAGLGIYEKIVNPGDALSVELHKVPNQGYVVQALYMSKNGEEILPIKYCGELCPLSKFIEVTQNSVPTNWKEECTNTIEPSF